MNKLSIIGSALCILGAIVLSSGFALESLFIWVIANPIMAIHNYRKKDWPQVVIFGFFTITNAAGIYVWLYLK